MKGKLKARTAQMKGEMQLYKLRAKDRQQDPCHIVQCLKHMAHNFTPS